MRLGYCRQAPMRTDAPAVSVGITCALLLLLMFVHSAKRTAATR
jgi:hypothetical protein